MSHCSCSQTSLVFTISTCSCRTRSSGSALLAPFLPFRAVSRECAAWCVCLFSRVLVTHTHTTHSVCLFRSGTALVFKRNYNRNKKNRDYSSVLTSLFRICSPRLFYTGACEMSVTCGSRPLPPLSPRIQCRTANAQPTQRSSSLAQYVRTTHTLLYTLCLPPITIAYKVLPLGPWPSPFSSLARKLEPCRCPAAHLAAQ